VFERSLDRSDPALQCASLSERVSLGARLPCGNIRTALGAYRYVRFVPWHVVNMGDTEVINTRLSHYRGELERVRAV
jgi:hypothetical protein